MEYGNFTTNYLALESSFFDQIFMFIHGFRYFFFFHKIIYYPKLK